MVGMRRGFNVGLIGALFVSVGIKGVVRVVLVVFFKAGQDTASLNGGFEK